MSLSETYISRKQLIADNLNSMGESTADVTDGLTTLAGKILDIPNKQSTILTISVPLNLEYGDDFNITGILTSAGNGISNATIKLKVGNTVVDTDTTDSEGEVSFTQCPVRTGNHSFQLIFEGDINYASSESTVVTRDVEKETSVITLDYPIASNHYSDEDIVVSGVLTDNDDTPIANKDITLKDGNAQLLIVTTESDGSFSDTINLNTGSHILNVIYEGDENYTASSVSRNVTIVAPSLSLSSDKDILSYNGGVNPDSATLTATLNAYDNVGKTVTFEVRKQSDDSLVETLTADTDSSGIATVSYLGKGVGDLNIKAKCNLLIQTYELSDIAMYDGGVTGNKSTAWTKGTYISETVNSTGTKLQGTSTISDDYKANVLLTGDFEVEFDLVQQVEWMHLRFNVDSNNNNAIMNIAGNPSGNTKMQYWVGTNSRSTINYYLPSSAQIKLVREGTSFKLYVGNNLKLTTNISSNDCYFCFAEDNGQSRYSIFKDLKIKLL